MRLIPLFILVVLMTSACTGEVEQLPNVVLIFTDDQGYGDLGCFGSGTISSPNVDRLAKEGMMFTDFHVAASVCTPSRAALLTGCYPNRIGLPKVLFPEGAWGSKGDTGLNPGEETIAELLKGRGYATAMAGKWHLGHRKMFLPLQHGFDRYFGIPYSNDMSKGQLPLIEGNEVIETEPDQSLLTKRYTSFCVDFIREKAGETPFFLYLAHTMPHIPIYASEQFRGKSEGGLYGDVIEEIDWSVGQIVSALEKSGVLENTLLIFTSDNGPWLSYGNHGGSAGELRGGKFDIFEGGFRVPCVMQWPGTIPGGETCNALVSTMDLLPTLCRITGALLPEKEIDGLDVYPLLTGDEMEGLNDRPFFYYSNENIRAVRRGAMKYIMPHSYRIVTEPGMDGVNGKSESAEQEEALYDLNINLSEYKNIILNNPDLAKDMKALIEEFDTYLKQEARVHGIDTSISVN